MCPEPHRPVPTGTPGIDAIENTKEPGTGLYCWKDKDRECGPECMAYIQPPNSKDYVGQQWAHCHILVNEHRKGKHLVILSEDIHRLCSQNSGMKLPDPPITR